MLRFILSLPFALGAMAPGLTAPPLADVRPVAAQDNLQGRWKILSVDGLRGQGLWLELGAEGPGAITSTEKGLLVGSPRPRTIAYLGCNDFRPNGWGRNGDKVFLGIEMSSMTERGCDPATMTLEATAHAILSLPMTMEIAPPDRLRLINERGALDLIKDPG